MAVRAIDKPDGALVREHLDGARQAFETLYRRYHPRLVRLCQRSTRDHAAAEDAAQETLLRALIHLERFDVDRPMWPWLKAIACRLLVDHARNRARELPVDDPQEETEPISSDLAEERSVLSQALAALSRRQQLAIGLRYVHDLDHEQAARLMELSGGAFRQILHRGRRNLRQEYRRLSGGLGGVVLAPFVWIRRASRRAGARMQSKTLGSGAMEGIASGAAFHLTAGVLAVLLAAGAAGSTPAVATPPPIGETELVLHARSGEEPTVATPERMGPPTRSSGSQETGEVVGSARRVREIADDVTDPNRNVKEPEDAQITAIEFVPGTNTVYAAGMLHCRTSACPPVLFGSQDGGASWTRLEASGFQGRQLLLPPDPRDTRIFAMGPAGLQVSEDGGASFVPVTNAPLPGPAVPGPAPSQAAAPAGAAAITSAAISPAFNAGDPTIVIGDRVLMQYRDDTGALGPGPYPLAGPLEPAYSPSYPEDPRLLIGGLHVDRARARRVATVFSCSGSVCTDIPLAPSGVAPKVRLSPDFAEGGPTFAFTPARLFVSDEAGGFTEIEAFWGDGPLKDVAISEEILLVGTRDYEGADGGLFVSRDIGLTWERASSPLLEEGALTISVQAGRLLAATPGGGIACSLDGARTWASRC